MLTMMIDRFNSLSLRTLIASVPVEILLGATQISVRKRRTGFMRSTKIAEVAEVIHLFRMTTLSPDPRVSPESHLLPSVVNRDQEFREQPVPDARPIHIRVANIDHPTVRTSPWDPGQSA